MAGEGSVGARARQGEARRGDRAGDQEPEPNTKDLAIDTPNSFRNEAPVQHLIGPTQERAGANGVVIRQGLCGRAWGDIDRADMTYSVTKTFLSTVVGEAYERGLIKIVTIASRRTCRKASTSSRRAQRENHLGSPAAADERLVGRALDQAGLGGSAAAATRRPSSGRNARCIEPGTFYKYNDTRVNVLALATLYIMKEPLPVVLKRDDHGPDRRVEQLALGAVRKRVRHDRRQEDAVGHRAAAITAAACSSTRWDMARFGYLFLNNGKWGAHAARDGEVDQMASTPGAGEHANYGFHELVS